MILPFVFTGLLLVAVTLTWDPPEKGRVPWHVLAAVLGFAAIVSWIAGGSGPPAKSPPPAWIAARDLAANTRLGAGDLRKPLFASPLDSGPLAPVAALTGKYLLAEHRKGAPVWPTDVGDGPAPRAQPGAVLLFFAPAAAGAARGFVNAGSRVLICEESKPCGGAAYTVEAVVSGDSGAIVVRVPLADVDRVRAIAKPALIVAAL
ncbi:MAG: SAF domain-containing protein [Acidobacteriota bacterium]|nr:SAF domain-containing protein [Acidobacteriota bacterium]